MFLYTSKGFWPCGGARQKVTGHKNIRIQPLETMNIDNDSKPVCVGFEHLVTSSGIINKGRQQGILLSQTTANKWHQFTLEFTHLYVIRIFSKIP